MVIEPIYPKKCYKCKETYPSQNHCEFCEPYARNAGEEMVWEEWLRFGAATREWNWMHYRTDVMIGDIYVGTRKQYN